MSRTIVAAAAAFTLLVPLAGCGADEVAMQDEATEDIIEEPVVGDDDTATASQPGAEGDDQTAEVDAAALPEDWPSDLPLPDDNLIVQVVDDGGSGTERGFIASFAASGTTESVGGQIREDMAAAGYQEQESGPDEQDAGGFMIERTEYESDAHKVGVTVSDMPIPDVPEDFGITVTYHVNNADHQ